MQRYRDMGCKVEPKRKPKAKPRAGKESDAIQRVIRAAARAGTSEAKVKQSNPKDVVGSMKIPASVLSRPVLAEMCLGMLEGALKYGRHNYRVIGVRASVYYDAAMRHLDAWWEGEDIDPDSGLPHIVKAMTTLMVLRDAMIRGKMVDDRPPGTKAFIQFLNKKAAEIIKRYENGAKPAYLGHGKADDYLFEALSERQAEQPANKAKSNGKQKAARPRRVDSRVRKAGAARRRKVSR